jgi:hypothetical protein
MEFTMATPFWTAHVGSNGKVSVDTILLWKSALQQLMLKSTFLSAARRDDPNKLYRINASSFAELLVSRGQAHAVPRHVRNNMQSLSQVLEEKVTFEEFCQFHQFQGAMNIVTPALVMASHRGRLNRVEFERAVHAAGQPPLPAHVVSVLFHVFNDPTALGLMDLPVMLACMKRRGLELDFSIARSTMSSSSHPAARRSGFLYQTLVAAKSFGLGGIAGKILSGLHFVYSYISSSNKAQWEL